MDTSLVMHKALQLAKHQHGMPAEQAFCEHSWSLPTTKKGKKELVQTVG